MWQAISGYCLGPIMEKNEHGRKRRKRNENVRRMTAEREKCQALKLRKMQYSGTSGHNPNPFEDFGHNQIWS